MKSMMRILSRYVLSAAGVALILLTINFAVLIAWTEQSAETMQKRYDIEQIADSLVRSSDGYSLSNTAKNKLIIGNQWAILIDNETGGVVWSLNQPSDVPKNYSLSDVASFTRWYLSGYPVTVWEHPDGLLVVGGEKDSVWKYSVIEPMAVMDMAGVWLMVALLFNIIAAVLLALLFGLRLFRSLKPLASGIAEIAEKRPVELSTRGLLGDLAVGINKTSTQLAMQQDALNRRDNARTTWIAGVSHDIRTPLSIVMGYASQLENDPELAQSKREQAGIIRRQSERIKMLVSDLNLASKLEYDMQPLRKREVVLSALLRSTVADFLNSGLSGSYSLDLAISEHAQSALVNVDEELLRRAISNLIANCIQHNPDGCAIRISLAKNLLHCILAVSDNGTGFSQDTLVSLNNPVNAAALQSHGLGLTLVRQIIQSHGGTTTFRNLPEGGCTVELCIPIPPA